MPARGVHFGRRSARKATPLDEVARRLSVRAGLNGWATPSRPGRVGTARSWPASLHHKGLAMPVRASTPGSPRWPIWPDWQSEIVGDLDEVSVGIAKIDGHHVAARAAAQDRAEFDHNPLLGEPRLHRRYRHSRDEAEVSAADHRIAGLWIEAARVLMEIDLALAEQQGTGQSIDEQRAASQDTRVEVERPREVGYGQDQMIDRADKGRIGTQAQTCPMPPSTHRSMPEMNELSSDARNSAAWAVSCGEPSRFIGTACATRSSQPPRMVAGMLIL